MKISITKTIEQEFEVPMFWTNPKSDAVFKVLTEDTCLMVLPFKNSPLICIASINMNFTENSYAIIENEFICQLELTKELLGCY
jgi:hypothetical protein